MSTDDGPFTSFDEFEAHPLRLPIRGKTYTLPPIGIRTALLLNKAIGQDLETLEYLAENDNWYREILGSAYDEMLQDNVPSDAVDRACLTACVDFKHGRVKAQIAWVTGRDPEGMAAFMAASVAIQQDNPELLVPTATKPAAAARSTRRRRSGSTTSTSRAAKSA